MLQYLLELTLVDAEPYLGHLPSVTAAACMCLANSTLNQPAWSQDAFYSTGFSMPDIEKCLADLLKTYQNAHSHPQQAVHDKYKHSK